MARNEVWIYYGSSLWCSSGDVLVIILAGVLGVVVVMFYRYSHWGLC